ncbi:MAG: HAMP domain-containing histidine kinase [Nevskiaceae bacterium]|nr:MAG: HAMP domain-containing histidine kinase [Nevskiaceae bacterium]
MPPATASAPVRGVAYEGPPRPPVSRAAADVQNMKQLIELRWIAVIGQVLTILFAELVLRIDLPLAPMIGILSSLIGLNLLSLFRWTTQRRVGNLELMAGLLLDVAALTALLYFSGGASNPFVFLYLLQVTLGAVLLRSWSTWTIVIITCLSFGWLVMHSEPLRLPADGIADLFQLHIAGMWICFVLNAGLLVVFVSRITRNLRIRDAHLADLRQRDAEQDHIVRMGLLASGAAHELGTPLATLAVILGDWQRMPQFRDDPELCQEIADMQAQVLRCKTIVTGILLSAGEARGESPVFTTIAGFLDALVAEWSARRGFDGLAYEKRFSDDRAIVSDSALKQIIGNVLDNALDVSPLWVGFSATHDGETLTLTVRDQGPGFVPEMLEHFGKPYHSSKGRPGGGLGLFLVVNVVRKLGGRVSAENAPGGGAVVTLSLPLSALTLEDDRVAVA